MKTSNFGGRRRRLLAAASLSLGLASPLFADSLDLAVDSAPLEVETSSPIHASWSNQAMAVGDLNDDGDLDLVLGAAGDTSGTSGGGVYVLFGPLTSLASPYDFSAADIEVTGGSADSLLGYAVLVADVNNDGDQDLLVGSPKEEGPSSRTNSGAVYVFFGPLSAGTLDVSLGDADAVIYGDDAGDQLGHTLTVANLTGTSAPDLAMGAPYADGYLNGASDAGEVQFINGPLSAGTRDLDSSPGDEIIWGANSGNHLYRAAVGELTGDAHLDLAVGAWGDNGAKASVRVFFGPITTGADFLSSAANWVSTGEETYPNDLLIADFDNDGQKDLIASAKVANDLLDIGAVFGFPGPLANAVAEDNWDEAALQIVYPDYLTNKGDVSSLAFHDISADGIPDLIVGLMGGAGPENDRLHAGQVNVFYGPVDAKYYDMSKAAAEEIIHGDVDMWLGQDVLAGDFDNDGKRDLAMLAAREATGVSSAGKVHILAGQTCYFDAFDDGTVDAGWNLVEFGSANQGAVSEAGGALDLTGDGTGIIAVSDDAVFLYRDDFSGDFRVEATIVGLPVDAGGTYRRGGLWVRSSATPPLGGYTVDDAPYVSVSYQPTGTLLGGAQLEFTMRQNWGEGGPSGSPIPNVPIASPVSELSGAFVLPVRVAIERIGSQFCVYYFDNADGHPEWKKPLGGEGGCTTTDRGFFGHPVINNQPDIGLMVAANHASTTATYRFDEYAICRP